ncbi:hypothetical protein E3T54_15375 [Cryobacterium sp. Sr8]|uniref:hypothetical protein n=1 Tax=Cryobacterium sp. Sr8 TaxID=1259203 RepID=UPI00106BD55A|nr:hypothetical protein [Cryobacterium sp. Sr8]TFD74168.1 hypothetical protein E3T54_15375 [Cryobacterium sp. Sr8]
MTTDEPVIPRDPPETTLSAGGKALAGGVLTPLVGAGIAAGSSAWQGACSSRYFLAGSVTDSAQIQAANVAGDSACANLLALGDNMVVVGFLAPFVLAFAVVIVVRLLDRKSDIDVEM